MTEHIRGRRACGTVMRGRRIVRRRLMLSAIIALSSWLGAGCEPCSGIAACASGPYLAIDGQIVAEVNGKGIDGVGIEIIRRGGIDVDPASAATVTANGGLWHIELSPSETGTLVADIVVSPSSAPSYRLHAVSIETREHHGDGSLNERWVPALHIFAYGEFFLDGTVDMRANGATVQFRRTGGAQWYGAGIRDDVWTGVTDGSGRVPLFPSEGSNAVLLSDDTPLIGELTVQLANDGGRLVMGDVSLGATHLYLGRNVFAPILRAAVPRTGTATRIERGAHLLP